VIPIFVILEEEFVEIYSLDYLSAAPAPQKRRNTATDMDTFLESGVRHGDTTRLLLDGSDTSSALPQKTEQEVIDEEQDHSASVN